jgi:hypothetical protein
MHEHLSIAPAPLLMQEWKYLQSREVLRTTWSVEEMIFLQSLASRAHEGHGSFHGRRFVDTAEDDVARALHLDPVAVRQARQRLIDEIGAYARRAMRGEAPAGSRFEPGTRLLNEAQEPLLGIGFFRHMPVEPGDILRGLYLGGLRDRPETRVATEQRYGDRIGAGGMFYVDREVMRRLGLNGERLAHGSHGREIDRYREEGLIVAQQPAGDTSVIYQYIRFHEGPGASDDAAIVAGSLLFGGSVSVGVFLADAIDTLEKYVPPEDESDQDWDLAKVIERGYPDLSLTMDDVYALTHVARGTEDGSVPDSSLRHMLRVDRKVDQCALEAHLLAAAGQPGAPVSLGHRKVPSDQFYTEVRRRVAAVGRSQ